jgi:alpha-2-macroglobulin
MKGCSVCTACKSAFRAAIFLLLASLATGARPQESAQQLLTRGDARFAEQRLQEAQSIYDRVLKLEKDPCSANAARAAQGTVLCALQLNEWDSVWTRVRDYRLAKGEDKRVSWDYWERKEERTRQAVQKLEVVRQILEKIAAHLAANPALATPERGQKLSEEQIATDFDTIELLVESSSGGSYRHAIDPEVWWNTKAQDEWDAEREGGRWRYWWSRDRGIPLGADGKPQLVAVPPSYAPGLGVGEKVLFLVDEIQRLDASRAKNSAARALLWRASLAVQLYGPITDARWRKERYDYDWSERPYFRRLLPNELSKPFWELADDEVRTTADGRGQILKLPDTDNPLTLLRLVEQKYALSDVVPDAIYARGEYYQSRQQFDQALSAYADLLKKYSKHVLAKDAAKQIEKIYKPGVLLWSTTFFLPGEKPLLPFVCRRTNQIHFTARAVDLQAYYRDQVGPSVSGKKTLFDSYGLMPDFTWDEDREKKAISKYLENGYAGYWSETVPDSERIIKRTTRVPLTKPGAYLIEAQATGDKATSQVMVVLTDIAIVHRQLRDKTLIYVADARTGRPVPNQEVYFYTPGNSRQVGKLNTNKEGIIETVFKGDRPDYLLGAVSKAGGLAMTRIEPFYESSRWPESYELSYAITDRPVYRPGARVHFRVYVRESAERRYLPPKANKPVHVSINGPHHRPVNTFVLRTDSFGGVSGDFELGAEAALGQYSIVVEGQRYGESHGGFRVESYKKPEFEVTVQPVGPARPGEKARVRVDARYLFGGTVTGGRVRYQIHRADISPNNPPPHEFDWLYGPGYADGSDAYPWLTGKPISPAFTSEERYSHPELEDYEQGRGFLVRQGEALLSDAGALDLDIDTLPDIDQRLSIEAEVRDASRRTVRGKGEVLVVGRELQTDIELDRGWYEPDARGNVAVYVRSAVGTGAAVHGKLRVERISYSSRAPEQAHFETVSTQDLRTDSNGRCTAQLPALPEGQYRASFLTSDSRRREVSARAVFWVHGPKFVGKAYRLPNIEIVPDRSTYKVGDIAHLLIHVAQPHTRILFSDDIRGRWLATHRFLDIADHVALIDVPIEARQVPNFFIGATAVSNGRVTSQTCELFVPPVRDLLKVDLESEKQVYRPGSQAAIRVAISDAAGKPAAGQITLAAYDKAITYIQDKILPRPTILLQQARVRRSLGMAEMQEDEKFEPSGSVVCPQYEIGGGRHLPTVMGGAGGGGGGTPDVQEQRAESVGSRFVDSGARLRKLGSSANDIEPVVRRDFADTALWRATVDVAADGKAAVTFPLPDSLTTWRVRAAALTKDTQTGEAGSEFTTSKNLLVRLQTPRFLVEGDEVVLSANVHNALKAEKRVTAELILPAKILQSIERTADEAKPDSAGNVHLRSQALVPAGGTHRFDWPCKTLHAGAAALAAKALTDVESDAVELPLPVLRRGSMKEEAHTGSFQDKEETQSFTITLPAKLDPSATELQLSLSPGPLGVMLDALPSIPTAARNRP